MLRWSLVGLAVRCSCPGFTVVVGDLLLQTTRVSHTSCVNSNARVDSADSQIQGSVCFPVEYTDETLSKEAFGSGSQKFEYVDGAFAVGLGSSSSGFFQPLSVNESSQWDDTFAGLRDRAFWDIQTHTTTIFCTLYSRNLHAVVAVTIAFTRLPSGNFAPTPTYQFYPMSDDCVGTNPDAAQCFSAISTIPGLVVAAAVALALVWMHIRAAWRFTDSWRQISALVVGPSVLACLVSLVCTAAAAGLLGQFMTVSQNAFSFELATERPDRVIVARDLDYVGAYSSQYRPALLFTMHSHCFAVSLATVCLPFAELALLWPFTREQLRLMSLSAKKLLVPVVADILMFCAVAASGRLVAGPVILSSGTILDWLRLFVDCLWHGQALFDVFTSPTSPAFVAQLAFVTACIIYVCAVTVPMYYAIVHDALLRLQADDRTKQQLRALDFSAQRLLCPHKAFESEEEAATLLASAQQPSMSLHTAADEAVWADRTGWLPRAAGLGANGDDDDRDIFAQTD